MLALVAGGCAESDLGYPGSTAPAVNQALPSRNARTQQICLRAAQDRSGDGLAQGFDADMQQKIYDRTYADCITWARKEF